MRLREMDWDGREPARIAAELRAAAPEPAAIALEVAKLVGEVRERGDTAARELGERLDGVRVESFELSAGEREELAAATPAPMRAALASAAANIRTVAEAQVTSEVLDVELGEGHTVRIAEVAVRSAAIYVPGGRAPYPSTVLMGAIAARAAGVERVVVATPPGPGGRPAAAIAAAAAEAGVDAIYAIGGAQAVAALAYGTESIPAVDVIAGPGGPWVQEAKLAVSRQVGIDGYAGPSELVVISDGSAERRWLALDLCAQAEHGADGLIVAICVPEEDAVALAAEVERIAAASPSVTDAELCVLTAPDPAAALLLSEALAPEHLQLACAGADSMAATVRTAGCVFTGAFGATAFGDYAAGSNHVLPTGGAGRFTGPLGPGTFRRRISIVGMNRAAAVELGGVVDEIARAEGFDVHGASARARAGDGEPK